MEHEQTMTSEGGLDGRELVYAEIDSLNKRIDELENENSALDAENDALRSRIDELGNEDEGEDKNAYGIPDDVLQVFARHGVVTDLGTSIRLAEAIEPILKEAGY